MTETTNFHIAVMNTDGGRGLRIAVADENGEIIFVKEENVPTDRNGEPDLRRLYFVMFAWAMYVLMKACIPQGLWGKGAGFRRV